MKVVVNCKSLKPKRLDGIGVYTLELLRELVQKRKDWEFIFVYDKIPKNAYTFPSNVKQISWLCPTYRPFILKPYLAYLNWICKREKADLLFCPDGWGPTQPLVPMLCTIHDLNFERNPEYLPKNWAEIYRNSYPKIARNSDHIFTVSHFSKSEIIELYGISADKISVSYNAVNKRYKPIEEHEKTRIRQKLGIDLPYFLYVGTLHARKNIKGMFKSYQLYRKAGGTWPLVIVGESLFGDELSGYWAENYPYKSDVIFTGRLSDEELARHYAAAGALFFIPFYEGFGIPVLEAMASGIPILTSSGSSLPEIVGSAALVAEPDDATYIAQMLLELERNTYLRQELVRRGFARVADFSWQKSMEIIEQKMALYDKSEALS